MKHIRVVSGSWGLGVGEDRDDARQRKLYVKTYGCQMNVYDSERMGDVLAPHGVTATDDINAADIIVLNTCHIREKAADKVYSELGRLRELKDERSARGLSTVVTVAGCVAQAEGKELLRRAPVVDLVVGPQSYHRLPELLARVGDEGRGIVDIDFPEDDKFRHFPVPPTPSSVSKAKRAAPTAFLTVQEGCDKFCTFCVVPYTRGAEYSRPARADPGGSAPARRSRRARDHAAGPERQRLSRRGPQWPARDVGWAACSS